MWDGVVAATHTARGVAHEHDLQLVVQTQVAVLALIQVGLLDSLITRGNV